MRRVRQVRLLVSSSPLLIGNSCFETAILSIGAWTHRWWLYSFERIFFIVFFPLAARELANCREPRRWNNFRGYIYIYIYACLFLGQNRFSLTGRKEKRRSILQTSRAILICNISMVSFPRERKGFARELHRLRREKPKRVCRERRDETESSTPSLEVNRNGGGGLASRALFSRRNVILLCHHDIRDIGRDNEARKSIAAASFLPYPFGLIRLPENFVKDTLYISEFASNCNVKLWRCFNEKEPLWKRFVCTMMRVHNAVSRLPVHSRRSSIW